MGFVEKYGLKWLLAHGFWAADFNFKLCTIYDDSSHFSVANLGLSFNCFQHWGYLELPEDKAIFKCFLKMIRSKIKKLILYPPYHLPSHLSISIPNFYWNFTCTRQTHASIRDMLKEFWSILKINISQSRCEWKFWCKNNYFEAHV